MARAGGDEWIYVLSKQEAVAEQATAAEAEEKKKESNAADDDEKASAQPSESDNKAAAAQSYPDGNEYCDEVQEYPYPDYYSTTPEEEPEVEKAYRSYVAAYKRAIEMDDELQIQKANRDKAKLAYMAADYHILEESEVEKASQAYIAAFRRAAEMDDELQIQLASRDKAYRAYVAAHQRAAPSSTGAAAGREPRGMENLHHDRYSSGDGNDDDTYGGGTKPGPYYRGSDGGLAAPASLGRLGCGYDNTYGFGFGLCFPTGAYSSHGYGGLGFSDAAYGGSGYGYGEPYKTYSLFHEPGYKTPAYQARPPALDAGSLYLPPARAMPSVYMALAPPPAQVSIRRPDVAPTTQPPEASCSWD